MLRIDPVCGMEVQFDADHEKNVPQSQFDGRTYYFCSDVCRQEFECGQEEYVGGQADEDQ
jgi:YHS domain-containing protein